MPVHFCRKRTVTFSRKLTRFPRSACRAEIGQGRQEGPGISGRRFIDLNTDRYPSGRADARLQGYGVPMVLSMANCALLTAIWTILTSASTSTAIGVDVFRKNDLCSGV